MAIFHAGVTNIFDGTSIDWDLWTGGVDGDFKAMLMLSTYTQNQAHDNYDDVSASESISTSYTAGGNVLPVATRTIAAATSPSDLTKFDAADVVYTAIGNGVNSVMNGAIVYRESGVDSTSTLIAYVPFPSNVTSNGGNVTIVFHDDGIFYLDATP